LAYATGLAYTAEPQDLQYRPTESHLLISLSQLPTKHLPELVILAKKLKAK